MGQVQKVRAYLQDNRRQQLNADLAVNTNMASAYQGFIAQVRLHCTGEAAPNQQAYLLKASAYIGVCVRTLRRATPKIGELKRGL